MLIPVCQKPYVSKKLGTTTKPCEMGVDCDFDIYPPLERTKANQEQYELFLREVLDTYGPRDGDGAEQGVMATASCVKAESEESYI